MQILVVDDQQPILGMLKDVLSDQGYDVLTATDGNAALDLYRDHRPAFTLTDISMPGMTGLELLHQIKSLNAEAAVMLMTGAGSETFAVEALRGGAVNYFNKPLDIHELLNTFSRYSTLALGYDFEHFAAEFIQFETLKLRLKNDIEQANHAVQMIVNHCRAIFPLKELFTLRFGLYEMIINAIEHGNLGIKYEEKSAALEKNRLSELIQERAQDPERSQRHVDVECEISAKGVQCVIRDQGEGFDHSVYSDAEDPSMLFEDLSTSLHGRGIILTSLQFDSVRFNDKGNEVCIRKDALASPQNGDRP